MKHTLIALVENEPGVLNRVASLFRRRNFNIDSLTVGRTENPEISRMTIVVDSSKLKVPQVIGNLYKLVNVIKVIDVTEQRFFSRDLALIKVKAAREVGTIADRYGARLIDHSNEMMTVEASDEEHRIEALIEELRPLGIVEVVRTGVVAMGRGDLLLQPDLEPEYAE
ncbi:MAG: acetolactate synthase small subunit [Anaerolineae bacterium]|nr:acetolactate synthase small subunit [Anaerolineae bacterium]